MPAELPPVEALRMYAETELLTSLFDEKEKAMLDVVHTGITDEIVADAIRESRATFFADFPETYELALFDDEISEAAANIRNALGDALGFVTEMPDSSAFARMSDGVDGFSEEQAEVVESVWNGLEINSPTQLTGAVDIPAIEDEVLGALFSPFGVTEDESDVIVNFGDPSGEYEKYEFQAIALIGEQLGITNKTFLVDLLGRVDNLVHALRQYTDYRTLISESPDSVEYKRAKDHFIFEVDLDRFMRNLRSETGRNTIFSGSVYLDTDADDPSEPED
jgi:hypothetical protein